MPECFGEGDEIKLGAYAVTEAGAGSDVKSLRTTAKLDGDEWVLNGTKVFISNGGIADVNVVVATVDPELGHRGQASFIVPKDTPGLSQGKKEDKIGIRASQTAEVVLEDVRIPMDYLLGGMEKLEKKLERARSGSHGRPSDALATFEITRPMVGASALGIAQAAYEWTLDYLEGKSDEGGPLLDQQRVQQTLADVATEIEAARLLVWRAAWMGRNGVPMTGGQGSMSKLKAGDVTMWATTALMDLVGEYAQTTDCPLEKYFRDAKIYQLFEGTAQVQRLVISRMQRQDRRQRRGGRRRCSSRRRAPATGETPSTRRPTGSPAAGVAPRCGRVATARAAPSQCGAWRFSLDPRVDRAARCGASALYVRAVRRLWRRRGYHVPVWQQVAWHAGVALTAVGLLSPGRRPRRGAAARPHGPAPADRGPGRAAAPDRDPLAGLRLPAAAPAARAAGPPRRACGAPSACCASPLVACRSGSLILYGWHFAFAFEARAAATTSCTPSSTSRFLARRAARLVVGDRAQAPAPARASSGRCPTCSARAWRACSSAWRSSCCARRPTRDLYGRPAREHGLSPLTDQQVAGGMMLGLDLFVMLFCRGLLLLPLGPGARPRRASSSAPPSGLEHAVGRARLARCGRSAPAR